MAYNNRIDDGEATKRIEDTFWSDAETYLNNLRGASPFMEKLFIRMAELGYDGKREDVSSALAFLRPRLQSIGAPELLVKTLPNWLNTGKVSTSVQNRPNIIKLCFALDMSADETKAFFVKALYAHSFNYKDLFEAASFFCMNTGRPYRDVLRIMEKISDISVNNSEETIQTTERVGFYISQLTTEDDFIRFWITHCSEFASQRITAVRRAEKLLEKCYGIATAYCEKYPDKHPAQMKFPFGRKTKPISTPDQLLSVIYGYSARSTASKNAFSQSIAKSDFPDAIKENFPQRQQIHLITHRKATYDTLRKTIIVLYFFQFFANIDLNEIDSGDLIDSFESGLNETLDECGYIQLYKNNPFDWMFYYCGYQEKPLDAFQDLIALFYLDKSTR